MLVYKCIQNCEYLQKKNNQTYVFINIFKIEYINGLKLRIFIFYFRKYPSKTSISAKKNKNNNK